MMDLGLGLTVGGLAFLLLLFAFFLLGLVEERFGDLSDLSCEGQVRVGEGAVVRGPESLEVELANSFHNEVGGSNHIVSASSLAGGVHVANRDSNRGRCRVHRCEYTGHGIGAGVASHDIELKRDLSSLGGALDSRVKVYGGDGAQTHSRSLTHANVRHALAGDSGSSVVVMVHVHGKNDVGLEVLREHAAAEASDFFVGGKRVKNANLVEDLHESRVISHLGTRLCSNPATETVVKVGSSEGVATNSTTDGSLHDNAVSDTESKALGYLLLAVFTVNAKLDVELVRLDALLSIANVLLCEVNSAKSFNGASTEGTVATGFLGRFRVDCDVAAEQSRGHVAVAVDVDLAVIANLADLHADLISVADDHASKLLRASLRVSVDNNAGLAAEPVHDPP
mmetsp:Transcript_20914/g.41003  ORF Transcript_20914/g.41003 Transcript_20914/m.41003 type:complete len:396 (+) Transcript_20914:380-1567(+)